MCDLVRCSIAGHWWTSDFTLANSLWSCRLFKTIQVNTAGELGLGRLSGCLLPHINRELWSFWSLSLLTGCCLGPKWVLGMLTISIARSWVEVHWLYLTHLDEVRSQAVNSQWCYFTVLAAGHRAIGTSPHNYPFRIFTSVYPSSRHHGVQRNHIQAEGTVTLALCFHFGNSDLWSLLGHGRVCHQVCTLLNRRLKPAVRSGFSHAFAVVQLGDSGSWFPLIYLSLRAVLPHFSAGYPILNFKVPGPHPFRVYQATVFRVTCDVNISPCLRPPILVHISTWLYSHSWVKWHSSPFYLSCQHNFADQPSKIRQLCWKDINDSRLMISSKSSQNRFPHKQSWLKISQPP